MIASFRIPFRAGRRSRDRRWRGQLGQSLVEFSLIIPLLLILVFGVIDFGMGLRAYISVSQATREAARFGSIGSNPGTFTAGGSGECNGSTTTTVVGRVCSTLDGLGLTNIQSVSVQSCTTASPAVCSTATLANMTSGKSLKVTANYQYHYITPVRRLVNFFSGGAIGSTLSITSATDMRIE